jgi:HEAT repeat protein
MALAALVAISALTGCTGSKDPLKGVKDAIFPPTPGEVARDAFNVYDADKRRKAVDLLAASKFGGEPAYLRMYRLLIDDGDPTVRASCVKALALHGQVEDVPLLITRLQDKVAIVRWESAKALQRIHSETAAAPLVKTLREDDDSDVRSAAAFALGQYANEDVFQGLVGALDDRKFGVVHSARRSLKLLTGYDFGSDAAAWLIWSNQNQGKLFAHQRTYTYMPYQKPRGLMDKAQFWKPEQKVEPTLPKGAPAVTSNTATSG